MTGKLVYWVWLSEAVKFSSSAFLKIYRKFTPEEAFFADNDTLLNAGLKEEDIECIKERSLKRAEEIINKCEKLNISIVTANSRNYPRILERLSDRPPVIYVRGNISLLKNKCATVVGTRNMTKKGKEIARETAEKLIDEGYLLVSGGADGIDSVALSVSLEKDKPSVVVLAVDIDKCYPVSNKNLIDAVAKNGVVISEYPPDANARYFATRNRILAALSDVLYVIEAPEKSGALITANIAKRLKINVFAPDEEGASFEGCRQLIKNGAGIIGKLKKKEKKKVMPELEGTPLYIYNKLLVKSLSDEELIDENHSVTDILIALTELELDGIITALPGGKYKIK